MSKSPPKPARVAIGAVSSSGGRRVGLISLGCPKNHVDSEVMLGRLEAEGHVVTDDLANADTVIVNTCGFIEEAKQESIDTILEVAENRGARGAELLVAGCMVNRYGAELASAIPEIDGFISLDDLREVDGLVGLGGDIGPPAATRSQRLFDHRDPRRLTTSGYGYLKVAEGCNNPCTFCAIPLWRGRFRSRTIESLVTEARELVAAGAGELVLVAQDTTRYGEDLGLGRHGLLRLVEALLAGTTARWIRFLYAYPTTLDPELLSLMAAEERFCSYLDMPLQHSHPDILRAMRRGGSDRRYLQQLETARETVPGIWLRSTFIVGFPGEDDEHFRHLESFVDQAGLDHCGGFTFSPEDGTPAADLVGRVGREVAAQRHHRLLEVQRPHSLARRKRLVGSTLLTLVEGVSSETEHLLEGRHEGLAPGIDGRLLLADGTAQPGTFAQVEVVDAYADDIIGHIVSSAEHAEEGTAQCL
ncbi:MAG: 30S ribosomal protein S12 methylthiotransferase RimO [Acidobacteriota bacterium]|nr:30S ribosomal protein S12 methylthiotransferase RimO [Acidobacteriota bacterium]